jgi:hypothetical protein
MNLSKTKFCTGIQCPKILWLDAHAHNKFDDSVVDKSRIKTGLDVGDLARSYFGDVAAIPYYLGMSGMLKKTRELLGADTPVIAEAAFRHSDNYCIVDILQKVDGGYEIIEVKSSTDVKDSHWYDMAYQAFVLKNCGICVKKVSLMLINNQYVCNGELDLPELFAIHDCTSQVTKMQSKIPEMIAEIEGVFVQKTEPQCDIGKHCSKPYPCGYKDWCFRNLPVVAADDTPPHIDGKAIREFLDTIRYPLYHLDFETMQPCIPIFDNCKPYAQIPTQYSLHIQESQGSEPNHREFLAPYGSDPRREIAERLCADIPQNSCVIAYNAAFEKMILKGLAELFPDLSAHLKSLCDNMIDLETPFRTGAYYCREMGGRSSIKSVLPALCPPSEYPELDYKLLTIRDGFTAMNAFAESGNVPETRAALLEYCRLDTLAMVRILGKLYDAINDS